MITMLGPPIQNIPIEPLAPMLSIYKIIGVILIFGIFGAVISYSKDLFDFSISDWVKIHLLQDIPFLRSNVGQEPTTDNGATPLQYPNATVPTSVKEPIASSKEVTPSASAEQTWCLIGQDSAGNWCVQVQNEKSCEKDRSFVSKNACERSK